MIRSATPGALGMASKTMDEDDANDCTTFSTDLPSADWIGSVGQLHSGRLVTHGGASTQPCEAVSMDRCHYGDFASDERMRISKTEF